MLQYPRNFARSDAGYRIAFRPSEHNICPGCSKSNWIVGRMTAECAFCGTALPLHGGGTFGAGLFHRSDYAEAPIAA